MRTRIDSLEAADAVNRQAYEEADRLYRSGRYREALRLFEIARDADPEDGDAHLAIGNCWDDLSKPKRAEAAYRSALACLPEAEKWKAIYNLGNALYDHGLYAAAIQVYRQVPAHTPAYEAAQKNRNRAAKQLGAES